MSIHSFSAKGVFNYKAAKEGDQLYVLLLNTSSFMISTRQFQRGIQEGSFFYKTLKSTIVKIQTNVHGEKYIRIFTSSPKNFFEHSIFQMSHEKALFDSRHSPYPSEMISLIEEHMSKMLGEPFKRLSSDSFPLIKWQMNRISHLPEREDIRQDRAYGFYYPFLKRKENYDFFQKLLVLDSEANKASAESSLSPLALGWVGVRGLSKALRNSQTIEEFVQTLVYKSALKTPEDMQCIIDNPHLLRVFSNVDMTLGAKEAYESGKTEKFENQNLYMSTAEFTAFKYLLGTIPKNRLPEVWKLMDDLIDFRKQVGFSLYMETFKPKFHNNFLDCERSLPRLETILAKTPRTKAFASAFLDEMKLEFIGHKEQTYPKLEKGLRDKIPFMKITDVHMAAYINTVMIPTSGAESVEKML